MEVERAVVRLRELTLDALTNTLLRSAAFFGEQLVALSDSAEDAYILGNVYFRGEEYQRAVHFLQKPATAGHVGCRYVVGQCLFAMKKTEECLEALGPPTGTPEDATVEAAICVLRGQVYEQLDNRAKAEQSYRNALVLNPLCAEAFERLMDARVLTAQQENEVLESLQFRAEEAWMKTLYASKIKLGLGSLKQREEEIESSPVLQQLSDSLTMVVSRAETLFAIHEFRSALEVTESVLSVDPCYAPARAVHVSCLYELKKSNELFLFAHQLVDAYPREPLSWFAVGAYYLAINDHEQARRYLSKATALDGTCGSAWIAFGHSFALEGEHDQAMAAYRTAARVHKGSHVPLLYIGMEYLHSNQLALAEQLVHQARLLWQHDPLVYHELGVIFYHRGEYVKAIQYLRKVVEICDKTRRGWSGGSCVTWEATAFNLGHAYRKIRDYDNALEWYNVARTINSQSSATNTAIAFALHLKGELTPAIEYYHKALSLAPDDTFASELLAKALAEEFETNDTAWDIPASSYVYPV